MRAIKSDYTALSVMRDNPPTTDSLLRQRYIAAGLIRPNTKELDPIQLNPGAIVFRINPPQWPSLYPMVMAAYHSRPHSNFFVRDSLCSH